jgi:hypothetical protein
MAESIPHPEEYNRPPVYERPLGGIVRVMDRLIKQGMTQADAIKPERTP